MSYRTGIIFDYIDVCDLLPGDMVTHPVYEYRKLGYAMVIGIEHTFAQPRSTLRPRRPMIDLTLFFPAGEEVIVDDWRPSSRFYLVSRPSSH